MSTVDFPWPALPGSSEPPAWSGRGFRVGAQQTAVLSYPCGASGWTDELTSFHEEAAGPSHPIDRASRRHALDQLQRHLPGPAATILEVGCSSGFMLRDLRGRFPAAQIIGSDFVRGPLDNLAGQLPEIPLLQFDVTQCPLPDASVDAVVLLNVLEHIADDAAALRHCRRILRPGGVAVIEVPAGPHLYDAYDRRLMHHRRYGLADLCRRVEAAGLTPLTRSHLGFFIYPPFRAVKRRNQRRQRGGGEVAVETQIRGTGGSRLLDWAMRTELRLGRWLSYPCGIRCLVTARKPAA